ncbi:hypothetical protein CSUI_001677 [Cystoisospora suis]|uniref:Uncharacterized protein n=1 Tax=Cystoisospora suis TaxID=483139 RepID=A0A2C6LBK5_9APIC|nr:hypothetical protein CSUI_001677 [Cystoisospora suis]
MPKEYPPATPPIPCTGLGSILRLDGRMSPFSREIVCTTTTRTIQQPLKGQILGEISFRCISTFPTPQNPIVGLSIYCCRPVWDGLG